MKIVAITHNNSRILEPLINSSHTLVGIVESVPKSRNRIQKIVRNIAFTLYGIFKHHPVIVKTFAWKHKIPYMRMDREQGPKLEQWLKNLKPDLIVLGSMYGLLKPNIINIPTIGVISIHPAYLPEYRGANTYFWIYYDNNAQSGVSVHWVNPLEDAGDVIVRERFDYPRGMKVKDFQNLMYTIAVRLLLTSIDDIEKGISPRIPQPKECPTVRARKVTVDEFKSLVRWQEWDVERIWHFFCGTEKYLPGLLDISPFARLWVRIEVTGFERKSIDTERISTVTRQNGIYHCFCRDGVVCLRIKRSLRYFIYNILSD